jgi:cytoskeleton protein RodZ
LLRETRESFGSDIHRVASALRIRAAYLEAIEEGRYDRLPGPVYALGFVRAYATHLGLDGEEAVRRFKLEAEGLEGQRDLSFPVPLSERSIPGGAMLLAALLLAVCGYGLWYYLSSTARPRPERVSPVPAELAKDLPQPAPAAAPASPAPGTAAAPSETAASPASAPTPPADAPAPATKAAAPTPSSTPAPAPASAAPTVAAVPASAPPPAATAPSPPPAAAAPAAAAPAPGVPAPQPTAALPPLPPQTAAVPPPPSVGATPVPNEPHVYGLANGDTRVVIHATDDSWIQIRDAEHVPIFTRQLHAGDSYHVPDRPGLTMRTGRGVALEITVDGKKAPPIGGAVRPSVSLDPERLLSGTALGAAD